MTAVSLTCIVLRHAAAMSVVQRCLRETVSPEQYRSLSALQNAAIPVDTLSASVYKTPWKQAVANS